MSEKNENKVVPIALGDVNFDDLVKKHSLMLIDCWAEWCGPCHAIAPVIDELAEEYKGQLIVGKLDVDDSPRTAERFGIASIPTLLIMKKGKEVDRIIGAVPKQIIVEKLKKHL